jgi:hypothetical protein
MIVDIKGKYHNQFNQTAFLALYKDYIWYIWKISFFMKKAAKKSL